jgi:hypothetical protein
MIRALMCERRVAFVVTATGVLTAATAYGEYASGARG